MATFIHEHPLVQAYINKSGSHDPNGIGVLYSRPMVYRSLGKHTHHLAGRRPE